jgi:hypothetical protein
MGVKLIKQSPTLVLLGCVYSHEVWFHLLPSEGLQHFLPAHNADLVDWWLSAHKQLHCIAPQTVRLSSNYGVMVAPGGKEG